MTKVCSKCGEERPAKGFFMHEKYCKGTLTQNTEKVKYPKQKAILSPEAYAIYLRKAGVTV
ncbi:hypothetical protein LCGC14_0839860 [marine sediment metagenome]|uniref:Uncharacterized protein n=1 Tax=marine sediment metagenome TaxID=412755 RepID=A0A0F9PYP4_9ZZZZ